MDHSPDDSLLVTRAAAGDRTSFDLIVRRNADALFRQARREVSDEDAADAVQTALVAAWRGLPMVRDPSRLRGWLRVLTRHECTRVRRRDLPLSEDLPAPEPPDVPDLHLLPAPEREAVLLCLADGLSVAEAAESLGLPRTTVESRLRNARLRLRTPLMPATDAMPPFSDLALPYDEFRWPTPPALPEPFGAFRHDWLLAHRSGATVDRVVPVDVERTDLRLLENGVPIDVRIVYSGRRGGTEDEAALLPVLRTAGIPVPALLAPAIVDPAAPRTGCHNRRRSPHRDRPR